MVILVSCLFYNKWYHSLDSIVSQERKDMSTKFSLWHVKMRTIFAQQDLDDLLLGIDKMPVTLTTKKKLQKDKMRVFHIHLHLSNIIPQDVLKEVLAALWLKLKQLCMTKSLTSKLNLKQRLYSHRMTEGGSLQITQLYLKRLLLIWKL